MSEDVLALHSPDGNDHLGPTSLIVAVDETGHEELADQRYQVFGLGGCVTVVGQYHDQIRQPWTALKERYFGGAAEPLHAAGLRPTPEQAAALGDFFRARTFGRFAAITNANTAFTSPLSRYESTALVMGHLLAEAAAAYRFDRVAVIFEHNERTEPLIKTVFSGTKAYRGAAAGRWEVPTQFYFAYKHMAEPLVEVSDFIMHAAGTAVRAHAETGVPLLNRRDFSAVFDGGPARRASFLRLDSFDGPRKREGTA